MDDNERMTATARRAARRLARRTGHSYQACLDSIARDCGRRHWADFMERPAPIPREEDRRFDAEASSREALTRSIGRPNEMLEIWGVGDEDLPEGWMRDMFLPRFNILAPSLVPGDRDQRRLYVDTVAESLIPHRGAREGYFELAGRRTLSAFLLLTVEDMGPRASIPAMIDMINDGLRTASDMRNKAAEQRARYQIAGDLPDYLAQWLGTLDLLVQEKGYDPQIQDAIVPMISMGNGERSGILGTMDKALLIFKNAHVRRRTNA